MSIAVLFGCASSASEEEGALQEEQKADRGFGECSADAVATAAAALPNDAAAAAREGAKMGAGGREGTGKEGPPEQSRAGFVLDKRRTTDGQFSRRIRWFNYLAAVRLIAARV